MLRANNTCFVLSAFLQGCLRLWHPQRHGSMDAVCNVTAFSDPFNAVPHSLAPLSLAVASILCPYAGCSTKQASSSPATSFAQRLTRPLLQPLPCSEAPPHSSSSSSNRQPAQLRRQAACWANSLVMLLRQDQSCLCCWLSCAGQTSTVLLQGPAGAVAAGRVAAAAVAARMSQGTSPSVWCWMSGSMARRACCTRGCPSCKVRVWQEASMQDCTASERTLARKMGRQQPG